MNKVFLSVCILLSLSIVACTVERGVGRFLAQDAQTDSGVAGVDFGTVGDEIDLELPWLLFTEDRRCIFADIGEPVENIVWSFYLVNFTEQTSSGRLVNLQTQLCHQYLSPLPFDFVTVIPDSVVSVLNPLDFVGLLAGREQGAPFITEPVIDRWGYVDEDGEDTLPTNPDDPRVYDQDEDGRPGVTLNIETAQGNEICELQVVQRTEFSLDGQVEGGRITGEFNVLPAQIVLTATSALCTSGDVSPSLAASRFELVALPNTLNNCQAIAADLDRTRQLLANPESEPEAARYCPSP